MSHDHHLGGAGSFAGFLLSQFPLSSALTRLAGLFARGGGAGGGLRVKNYPEKPHQIGLLRFSVPVGAGGIGFCLARTVGTETVPAVVLWAGDSSSTTRGPWRFQVHLIQIAGAQYSVIQMSEYGQR